jgi:hypothetical protein
MAKFRDLLDESHFFHNGKKVEIRDEILPAPEEPKRPAPDPEVEIEDIHHKKNLSPMVFDKDTPEDYHLPVTKVKDCERFYIIFNPGMARFGLLAKVRNYGQYEDERYPREYWHLMFRYEFKSYRYYEDELVFIKDDGRQMRFSLPKMGRFIGTESYEELLSSGVTSKHEEH